MALILLTGTSFALIVRIPEHYPWWYTAWTAVTGGTGTGTIAWMTAVIYTAYEELDIMVLSRIVRERDRREAESQRQEAEAQRQEAEAQRQEAEAQRQEAEAREQEAEVQRQEAEAQIRETEARRRTLEIQEMELAERQQALALRERVIRSLSEHLPTPYREEFERLTFNGNDPEVEQ